MSEATLKDFQVSRYRTHTCFELGKSDVGKEVVLSGWMMRKRDHGGVVFVDLRDHYGVTQVVFHDEWKEIIQNTRVESALRVCGKVVERDAEMVNPKVKTGEIEVYCSELEVLSEASVLPFLIAEDDNAPEAARLKHRFLELRREKLHDNVVLRSQVISAMREIMCSMGFTEYQTPILTSSSPEGARDFIVPSRLHPGKFFALPQAPQQFKQLIMMAGFDRYFQIAPCFRDEDARADRSPGEFYQLDMELSFVEQEDVMRVNEHLLYTLFSKFTEDQVTATPFPRISYRDALAQYGSDKPDLRNPLKIECVSDAFRETEFKVFRQVIEGGGNVQAIKVEVDAIPPRSYFDSAIEEFKKMTGQGLAYLSFDGDECKGSIAKFFGDAELSALRNILGIDKLCSVFFAAGPDKDVLGWMGRLRTKLGADFEKIEQNCFRFCWITDYPLYERDPHTGKLDFSHNPFSMPRGGVSAFEDTDPEEMYCDQYDVVCNGHELASGAIRNHLPEVMYKAFGMVGHSKEDVDREFGGMIRAFQYGAPPHGGIAYGLERIVMLLAGEEAIREVIMFPLAQTGEDLLMSAPSELREEQLKEVHIRVELPPEEILKQESQED